MEFVAGQRAVATARRDFSTLTEAAALFSAHIYDLPQQARKALDEIRSLRKQREQSQEELAEAQAAALLARDVRKRRAQIRGADLFGPRRESAQAAGAEAHPARAQHGRAAGDTSPQPSLVFAQSPGQPFDMGGLLKQTLASLGGRGGGSKDMAQGGAPSGEKIAAALVQIAHELSASLPTPSHSFHAFYHSPIQSCCYLVSIHESSSHRIRTFQERPMKRKAVLLLSLSIVAIACMAFAADKNPVVGGQPMYPQQRHHRQRGQLRRPHHPRRGGQGGGPR